MSPPPNPVASRANPAASPSEAGALHQGAPAVPGEARIERVRAVLKDKNLGLLCDDPSLDDALLAYRAAADLGARVALVRPRFTGEQELRAVPETAHMLGRLYDVLVCVALPADLVKALRRDSGVPVVGDIDVEPVVASAGPPPGPVDDLAEIDADQRLRQWQRALADGLA